MRKLISDGDGRTGGKELHKSIQLVTSFTNLDDPFQSTRADYLHLSVPPFSNNLAPHASALISPCNHFPPSFSQQVFQCSFPDPFSLISYTSSHPIISTNYKHEEMEFQTLTLVHVSSDSLKRFSRMPVTASAIWWFPTNF